MEFIPEQRPRHIVIGQSVDENKHRLARTMRRQPTLAEYKLWQALRRNQLGLHFRRQQIIAGFIVDFYCHSAALAVEVDGSGHAAEADRERDAILTRHGVRVLRVTNEDVLQNIEDVLTRIAREVT